MTKANTIPPQGGSRPTGLQLVASWQAIWNASLKGEKRALLDATLHCLPECKEECARTEGLHVTSDELPGPI